MTSSESDGDMLPSTWSEGQIAVRAVVAAQTPALHAAVTECVDIVALDPTFTEVPESEVGELVKQSVAEEAQERGFRMRSIHVGPAEELAGYFHLHGGCAQRRGRLALDPRNPAAIPAQRRRHGHSSKASRACWPPRVSASPLARVYLANVPALQFWTRLGFTEIVPHRGDYIGQDLGKPCIVLRAPLGGS